jgi:hypothetical protein
MVIFNSYVTNYQMDPEGICSRIHDFPMEIHLASYPTQRGYPRRVIAVSDRPRPMPAIVSPAAASPAGWFARHPGAIFFRNGSSPYATRYLYLMGFMNYGLWYRCIYSFHGSYIYIILMVYDICWFMVDPY